MNERWRDQADFHRGLANKAVSEQRHPDNVHFLDREARVSEGLTDAFKQVTDERAKSHKRFVSMMQDTKSNDPSFLGHGGGSRRRNKKTKTSKKRSKKSRKNHRRK